MRLRSFPFLVLHKMNLVTADFKKKERKQIRKMLRHEIKRLLTLCVTMAWMFLKSQSVLIFRKNE